LNWSVVTDSSDTQQDWPAILDELKQKEFLKSDAKLAESLGVTSGFICSVRKGRKQVSLKLATQIFSRLGKSFETKLFESAFLPLRVRERVSTLSELRRAVISRAHGNCQLCDCPAPFNDAAGYPFLEVHHVVPLHGGGDDSMSNLVALCPNCHRKIQVAPTQLESRKLLQIAKKYSNVPKKATATLDPE
jgi:plasmid maintenance system antidote protein VapI